MITATSNDEGMRRAWLNLVDQLPEWCAKIQPLFQHNNWQWSVADGGQYTLRVPTAEELRANAYSLAWEAYSRSHGGVSSGRLTARFYQDCRGTWCGSIAVVPEEMRVDGDRR